MHHIWIFISRTVAPNLENGETGDYVAWLDASGQITRGKESSAPVLIPAIPSLILNPVGPCQPNSRTPKATWAAKTAVSPPTFLSLFYEREIYISRVQPTCTQAAEFARKSTMQNYCPHTSFPFLEFGYADEESHLPHRRATLCSFTPGDLHSR